MDAIGNNDGHYPRHVVGLFHGGLPRNTFVWRFVHSFHSASLCQKRFFESWFDTDGGSLWVFRPQVTQKGPDLLFVVKCGASDLLFVVFFFFFLLVSCFLFLVSGFLFLVPSSFFLFLLVPSSFYLFPISCSSFQHGGFGRSERVGCTHHDGHYGYGNDHRRRIKHQPYRCHWFRILGRQHAYMVRRRRTTR